jgi:hypothetical protein
LDAFRPDAELANRPACAFRATFGDRHLRVAVVAPQQSLGTMQREGGRAAGARRNVAACAAEHEACRPAPVDEEDALLAAREPAFERFDQPRAEDSPVSARELARHVDDVHLRKALIADAPGERHQGIATGLRSREVLERRCCAARHEYAVFATHPFLRHGDGMVARYCVLLVARFMRFVDDDQPHAGQRRENGAARAHDDRHVSSRRRLPSFVAFAFREGRMQDRDAIAERCFETPGSLRRQRNLRDEDDRAAAVADDPRDSGEINVRLPASRHAVQQQLSERSGTEQRLDLGDGGTLFVGRLEGRQCDARVPARANDLALDFDDGPGLDGARDHRLRKSLEQRVGATQLALHAHARRECGSLRPGDRSFARDEDARVPRRDARSGKVARSAYFAAAGKRSDGAKDRAAVAGAARFGMP